MSVAVPTFLSGLDRWVLWHEVSRGGRPTKLPISVRGGAVSDITDPKNWGSYAFCTAARARTQGAWDGEGIVLGDLGIGEVLVGLDLDSCLAGGILAAWAQPYLDALDTYAEVSPSGSGLKLFFRVPYDDLPAIRSMFSIPGDMNGRKKTYANGNGEAHGPAAEIYLSHRYFTVTGQQWPDGHEYVALVGIGTMRAIAALFGPRETTGTVGSDAIGDTAAPAPDVLRARLAAAMRDRPHLAERWLGDTAGLTDASRSGFDMSLGSLLKAAGFTYGEMRAALIANPHGAGRERADDDRYFERIWVRSVVPAKPPEEEPPIWVTEGPSWDSIDAEAQHAAEPPAPDKPELTPFLATEIGAAEWANIPPRERVYGHFLFRKFISALGAPGGAGKTAYAFVVAFAVALKRNLLREPVHEQGNVWIYNLEDPRTELLRRVKACAIAYNIDYDRIAPHLFLDSGRDRPLVIASKLRDGSVIAWPQVPALIAEIKRRGVRLLIVDPFVRSHRVEENHNDEIDFVAALWAQVADQADCAILLVHHFKKGGVSGDASAFRGATALIDASRAAVTLTTMSADEAQRLNIDEKDRWQYIRVDSAKLNLAPQPENAVWLHLLGIDLQNGADGREPDNVQTVERWEPKTVWADTTTAGLNEALDLIAAGPEPGILFNATRRGGSNRWAGQVLVQSLGLTEPQAGQMIKDWLKNETLEEVEYHHPTHRRLVPGVRVNDARRPGVTL